MAPQTYPIRAYYLAKSLSLAEIEKKNDFALLNKRRNSLVFQPASDKMLAVFSFGVVVLFNCDDKACSKFVKQAARYATDPLEKPNVEEYEVIVDPEKKPGAEFNSVYVSKLDPDQIHLISEVLAQSVAIDFVEERVERFVTRFEKIYSGLEKDGKIRVKDIEVRKAIGAGRNIVQYVITQLSLLDKPDTTWEDKDLETLFISMRRMFELEDRFKNVEFRLNFIQDTSELVLDILENKRSVNLEMAIIYLFVIDIALVLYEVFFK
jgi:uncharacterized Rmd1/YagE family protein